MRRIEEEPRVRRELLKLRGVNNDSLMFYWLMKARVIERQQRPQQ